MCMVVVCNGIPNRAELIKQYFLDGLTYNEILCFLAMRHGTKITLGQLHRILRSLSLYRRHEKSSTNEIVNVVSKELEGSSSQFGYRQMHQKIRSKGCHRQRNCSTYHKNFGSKGCVKSCTPSLSQAPISFYRSEFYVAHGRI